MKLYAISHKTSGNPSADGSYCAYTLYAKEAQAQAQLELYEEEYQKFYEVRSFTIKPNEDA